MRFARLSSCGRTSILARLITEFALIFPDFRRLKGRRTKTRRFPDGDPFVRVLSFIRGTVYTSKFFICSIYSWRAAKFNEGKKEGKRAG